MEKQAVACRPPLRWRPSVHGSPAPPPLGLASSRRGGAAQIPEGEPCGLGRFAEDGRGSLVPSSEEAESSGIPRQRRALGADAPLWRKAAAANFCSQGEGFRSRGRSPKEDCNPLADAEERPGA